MHTQKTGASNKKRKESARCYCVALTLVSRRERGVLKCPPNFFFEEEEEDYYIESLSFFVFFFVKSFLFLVVLERSIE